MNEPEFVVTEGRAYHAGDVVMLRLKNANRDLYKITVDYLKPLEEKTGVTFVLLGGDVEVVEPSSEEKGAQ